VGLRPISAAECQRLPVSDPSRFFQIRELCQNAAEGSAVANYQLGVMYADGQGVPVRRELAVRLLSVAASHGLRPAAVRLEQMGYAAPGQ
jgi:TPR repeat protein